jgi:hypothetical protein
MLAAVRNRGITMQARSQELRDGLQDLGRICDFCGDRVTTVRRVALDAEYDRLQKAHREQYSCSSCFEDKEQRRLGLLRS